MGSYADAYIKVFGMSGVSYIDRMLIGFEEEMSNGCIGTISQLYDGNPPFTRTRSNFPSDQCRRSSPHTPQP